MILIHSTHEAGLKFGGIGAVLDGLLAAPSYRERVDRTVVVGPLNTRDGTEMERIFAPRNGLWVRYFSERGMMACDLNLALRLSAIEREWGVRILYGTRMFGGVPHEVILVDASQSRADKLASFEYYVWQKFGLDCGKYNGSDEFQLFMRCAEPQFAAVSAVLDFFSEGTQKAELSDDRRAIICHEFMGLPLWYAAQIHHAGRYESAYVAHECPTARALVESDGGHDTRFYNIMRNASYTGATMDDVFGDQSGYFKHGMVKTADTCWHIMAVGDPTRDELGFLDARLRNRMIHTCYNGVPAHKATPAQAQSAKQKLRGYARNLMGFEPTFVFSHVTRLVVSKGLWRDLRVMEQLDDHLAFKGETAVLFMLSSSRPQGRSSADAQRMSREYGWPANHRAGWPDLVDNELDLYRGIAEFNSRARASRIVLINQFGFSRDRCGESMPADVSFDDLRLGTDLEFGQSIYEPFGIAQLEPLSSGALCALSNVCGCMGFVNIASNNAPPDNIIVGDYTHLDYVAGMSESMRIGTAQRDEVERRVAADISWFIIDRLPRSEEQKQKLMEDGQALAAKMSWDVVAGERFLPVFGV